MKNDIGLAEQNRKELADGLNIYLANLHVLYTKLHNFHWNVEGKGFFQLHAKLEELYDAAAAEIDDVAERILQLGHRPLASMKEYLEIAQLKEIPSKAYDSKEVAQVLSEDFSFMAKELRKGIELASKLNDPVTADKATGTLAAIEKTLWMLKAYQG